LKRKEIDMQKYSMEDLKRKFPWLHPDDLKKKFDSLDQEDEPRITTNHAFILFKSAIQSGEKPAKMYRHTEKEDWLKKTILEDDMERMDILQEEFEKYEKETGLLINKKAEKMIETIKKYRERLDLQMLIIANLGRGNEFIGKAYDSLSLGRMWMGKTLGTLGNPSPYPKDGERKSILDIEPAADKYKDDEIYKKVFDGLNDIEIIDRLRRDINLFTKYVKELINGELICDILRNHREKPR